MNKIQIALSSGAFWSLVGVFVYGGLEAIVPSLGGNIGAIVQGALVVLALILHPAEVQKAGRAGAAGRTSY